jgi:hypothetical protein
MKKPSTTPSTLEADLKLLGSRAYDVASWAEAPLRRYHAVAASLKGVQASLMQRLHAWSLVPLTLWPFSITDLMAACLDILEKGRPLERRLCLIIELLPETPDEKTCRTVAEHEWQVQKGVYENLVKTQAKFAQAELALRANDRLQDDWNRIKESFDIRSHQDHKGVIRRTMGAERNMRPGFPVSLGRSGEAFRLAFDAFCLRWNLYGMQHDEPLLLKLAVNVTPHGTMILIPSFWSFDNKRDLHWDAINKLHRLRVKGRQGAALAEGLAERMAQAAKLRLLDAEAKAKKLRGSARHRFLCQGLGWVEDTDAKRLRRLRKEFSAIQPAAPDEPARKP